MSVGRILAGMAAAAPVGPGPTPVLRGPPVLYESLTWPGGGLLNQNPLTGFEAPLIGDRLVLCFGTGDRNRATSGTTPVITDNGGNTWQVHTYVQRDINKLTSFMASCVVSSVPTEIDVDTNIDLSSTNSNFSGLMIWTLTPAGQVGDSSTLGYGLAEDTPTDSCYFADAAGVTTSPNGSILLAGNGIYSASGILGNRDPEPWVQDSPGTVYYHFLSLSTSGQIVGNRCEQRMPTGGSAGQIVEFTG